MTHRLHRFPRDVRAPFRIFVLALAAGAAACGDADTRPDTAIDAGVPVVTDECSLAFQDCPVGYKCTYALHGVGGRACRPVEGMRQEGESCTGSEGDDDCDRGLFCEAALQACVKFCDRASHCASDQDCVQYRTSRVGVCRARCTIFDDTGCPAGATCRFERVYGVSLTYTTSCRGTGTVPTAGSCDDRNPCASDHSCLASLCFPHCDDSHPCADSSETCLAPQETLRPNPNHAGTCFDDGQQPSAPR